MNIEYEATFKNIDRDDLREKLKSLGATLEKSEFLQTRKVFSLPDGQDSNNSFFRIRDEGDKITMTLKIFKGEGIERQREVELEIDDFNQACLMAENLGMKQKAFQESTREIWKLGGVEIMIDEWPFLEPFCEIEGNGEAEVRKIAEELGFDWSEAIFDTVGVQYIEKYKISEEQINQQTPEILFDMENPFIK